MLLQADAEAVPLSVLQSRTSHDNDDNFADKEATETTCALLRSIMSDTRLKVIETDTTFCHINWCHVHPRAKPCKHVLSTMRAFGCK